MCFVLRFIRWEVRDNHTLLPISSVDAFIDAELLIKAQRLGYSITEIGVTHRPREAGTSGVKTKVILSTIKEMIEFYLHVRAEDRRGASL